MAKILLIEDNEELRENTAELLELSGYEVLTAPEGKTGVELASAEKPDLIICDVMMPELDGFGVLHILSKNKDTARIPFIFLTAKTDRSDFRKGMNLGADDYLTKPFEEIELLDAVESRIKKHSNMFEGMDSPVSQPAYRFEDFKSYINSKKKRMMQKKDIIFREGDFPNSLIYIVEGKIKTFKTNEHGKEYITGLFTAGDFLGYSALLEGSEHVESAEVLGESSIIYIAKDEFINLLSSNTDLSQKFLTLLSHRVNESEDRLLQLAYDSVRKRVGESLLILYDKFKDSNSVFDMAVSRDDLANLVGTAKETVIRTLSDFKEEGFIAVNGSNIKILEVEKLRKLKT